MTIPTVAKMIKWRVWKYVDAWHAPQHLGDVECETAWGALERGRMRLEVRTYDDGAIFVTPVIPHADMDIWR